jgi:Pyruvate/2-oxoacid:ferredoxin oxidoreductase delta subunit
VSDSAPLTFDYDYDEEARGFPEPPMNPGSGYSGGQRVAIAVIALGVLALVLGLINPGWLGAWGPAATYGMIGIGVAMWGWLSHRGSVPGIKHDGIFFSSATARGAVGWGMGIFITGFYVAWYWYDSILHNAIRLTDPVSQALRGAPSDKWFFYGFLYTVAVVSFGVRMFMKYRHNRYHLIRTASVMFFQLVLAFLIPHTLRAMNHPEFYFSYFWPLQYKALFPSEVSSLLSHPGGLGAFLVSWGLIISFVAVPLLTYYLGKRWYCSWVCGCGGLAETMGDPYRQLSDKSSKAWKIERWMIHAVLVFITLTTALLWINDTTGATGPIADGFRKTYGFVIGAVFSGVIGVGFYPVLGSRVWCRFGCPQAAILGIIQRYFSRFRITTNGGQCMSCGNCSTYCEMGIDVRAYAQRQENIVRASCVGCGVCAAVCPRGVLKLENGSTHGDRYAGSDEPGAELARSLGLKPRHVAPRDQGLPDGSPWAPREIETS